MVKIIVVVVSVEKYYIINIGVGYVLVDVCRVYRFTVRNFKVKGD